MSEKLCPCCDTRCEFIRSNIDPHKNMMCPECEYELLGEAFDRIAKLESELAALKSEFELIDKTEWPGSEVISAYKSNLKYRLEAQTELLALRKRIDDAPEVVMFQAADMWNIRLDDLSTLFGFGMYNDMKPGETRRFKLVRVDNNA